jgi:hypothetical protein
MEEALLHEHAFGGLDQVSRETVDMNTGALVVAVLTGFANLSRALRRGWRASMRLDFGLVRSRLLGNSHPDFRANSPTGHEVERNYSTVTWPF